VLLYLTGTHFDGYKHYCLSFVFLERWREYFNILLNKQTEYQLDRVSQVELSSKEIMEMMIL